MKFVFIILIIESILGVKVDSDWIILKEFSIPKNRDYLITISNVSVEIDIKLYDSIHVISNQKSLVDKGFSQYIYIPKNKENKYYSIKLKPKYNIKLKNLPKVELKDITQSKDLDFYKLLYDLTQEWNDYSLVQTTFLKLKNIELTNEQATEVLFYKSAIYYKLKKYTDVLGLTEIKGIKDPISWKYRTYIKFYKAQSFLQLGDFVESINQINSALNEFPDKVELSIPWQLNRAYLFAYYGLAQSVQYYFDNNNNDDGFKNIDTALSVVREIGDKQIKSEVLYILGAYYSAKKDWKQSIATLNIAEKYSVESNNTVILDSIYNQKGIAYRKLGQINNALKFFRKSIEILENSHDKKSIHYLYNGIASIYEQVSNFKQAKRYLNKSYSYFIEMNYKYDQAIAQNALGRIARDENDVKTALRYHNESREYFKNRHENGFINLTTELSLDNLNSNELQKSELFALQVLILTNMDNLDIYKNMKFWDAYRELSNKSNDELKFILNTNSLNYKTKNEYLSIYILAKIALLNFKFDRSKAFLEKIDDSNEILPVKNQLDLYDLEIDYFLNSKSYQEIDDIAASAIKLINDTRTSFDISDIALYWTNQAQLIINKYINVLVLQGKYKYIFTILEKYYAVNLREKRTKSNKLIIEQESNKIQIALDEYISSERNSILENNSRRQLHTDEAKERYLSFNRVNDLKSEVIPLNYLSIQQVQDKLSKDELFLRYYINDNNAFVFVIEKNKYEVITLPNKQKLYESVKQILNTIKSRRFTKLSDTKQFLAQLLPIEKIYSGQYKKMIIIPDGALDLLPFGALNISQNANEYNPLATIINVERTYSASDYFSQSDIPQNSETISVLANPVFIGNANKEIQLQYKPNNKLWEFKALPFSEQEARNINEIFSDQQVNLLMGENATNENFLSEQTRNSNIIHIASHGFFNAANLEEVGIATSVVELDENGKEIPSAGILAMREILYKPFKSNLVVISGCETTLGKKISGEGYNSLSRGLLSQGVGSVIGTIWSISDRATPIFMKEFYTNLKDMHGNVSKALNTTKRNFATLPKFRRYRHPYYWAGFVLTSSNRKISENIFN